MSRKRGARLLVAFLILAGGAAVAAVLIALGPTPEATEPEPLIPTVRVERVRLGPQRIRVRTEGTVRPAVSTRLSAEVAGRVVWADPAFREGNRVAAGAPLVRLERVNYEQAVLNARSVLAQAELRLAGEEAQHRLAVAEWEGEEGEPPDPLALREPQLAEARAARDAAASGVLRAERDLERTEIRAPYDGLVRTRMIEAGEFVAPGAPVGEVASIEVAEVRLPLREQDLLFLDLPLWGERRSSGPHVRATAGFGGPVSAGGGEETWAWEGRIVRVESDIAPGTRFTYAIAEFPDPYARFPAGRPPLASGMFVSVEIEGEEVEDVAVIPIAALHSEREVLVAGPGDRIELRPVTILWPGDGDTVLIGAGLAAGDRLVTSRLAVVAEGMRVNVDESTTPPSAGSAH